MRIYIFTASLQFIHGNFIILPSILTKILGNEIIKINKIKQLIRKTEGSKNTSTLKLFYGPLLF